jgi:hypothetical protein
MIFAAINPNFKTFQEFLLQRRNLTSGLLKRFTVKMRVLMGFPKGFTVKIEEESTVTSR